MLTPAADTRAADWIVASLTTFAVNVESLVPAGFDAYVRVFHPATKFGARVRWHEIATATGSTPHAGMQLPNLTGTWSRAVPGLYDCRPEAGKLPRAETLALAAVLRRHTQTPGRCWFATWEGWGALRDDIAAAPTFQVPERGYHLLWGGIDAVTESVEREPFERSQSIWWPDDRAWCVATEIDLDTTFVGCSRACAAALVGSADLEAFEVDPTWYFNDDQLNAEPSRAG